jgi:hypothetical protein
MRVALPDALRDSIRTRAIAAECSWPFLRRKHQSSMARSILQRAYSLSLAMGLTTILTAIWGLSTEIRLSASSLFSRKIGRLRTSLDTLPMSGVKGSRVQISTIRRSSVARSGSMIGIGRRCRPPRRAGSTRAGPARRNRGDSREPPLADQTGRRYVAEPDPSPGCAAATRRAPPRGLQPVRSHFGCAFC